MKDLSYSFGAWMKQRRKEQGLTQKELADRAYCSINTIKKIEADQRRPSRELAESLARALAIPDSQLAIFIECARGQRPVDHLTAKMMPGTLSARPGGEEALDQNALPAEATELIGRETELALLHRLLEQSWLVTIVGIGGIGKTRLALAYAADQQRAARVTFYASLVGVKAEDSLAAAFVQALGLQLAPGTDPLTQLLSYIHEKRLLLVLDNFEHLLSNVELLAQMHRAAPGLSVLVTSRERLRIDGEQLLPLRGLSYPLDEEETWQAVNGDNGARYPAAQLFLERARRLLPEYLPKHDDDLLQLCRITDGLPLALELAAAWIDSMTLPDLVQELQNSLDLLTRRRRGSAERHHSVRAVFDATWQFLSDAEQKAFVQLTVFSGGFTRQAAQVVAEAPLSVLSRLVGRYLVQFDRQSGRYSLHELLRQYGAEQLQADPSLEESVRRRHARFFGEYLTYQEGDLKTKNQLRALANIQIERANIWAACIWAAHYGDEAVSLEAMSVLVTACRLKSWIEDGYNLFGDVTRSLAPHRNGTQVLPVLLYLRVWRSLFAFWLGKLDEAPLMDERMLLLELSSPSALRQVAASYHVVATELTLDAGERESARRHGEQAVGLYEALDDQWEQANALNQLGTVCWNVGAYTEARGYFEESLALHRQLGDMSGVATSLDRLGLLLMHQGELEMSNRYLGEAIEANRALGSRLGVADVMLNYGSNLLEMGRFARARERYLESAALYDGLGIRHLGYTVLKALTAFASVHAGAYRRAKEEAQEAVTFSQQYGHKRSAGLALITLGMTATALNDDETAVTYLATGARYLREINQLEELAQGLGTEALMAFHQGQIKKAKQLVLEALAIVTEIQGLWSSPSYALAAWALMLADEGEEERARIIYELALAEPFTASSRWFKDIAGQFIPHAPPSGFMPPGERWATITRFYQELL